MVEIEVSFKGWHWRGRSLFLSLIYQLF